MDNRIIVWFGAGAASAVAAHLTLRDFPDALVVYCETNAEHPDNARFIADCETWFGKPIERIGNTEYLDTWDVWEQRKFIAGPDGAPCTGPLKRQPRERFQRPDDIHVFGYTADAADVERAARFRKRWPELTVATPLIKHGVTKEGCLAMVERAGIEPPPMYALGFKNNNCIPCPKATSPNYWSAIRLHFPDQFERMAKLSRKLGARLTRINDERIFIDEIPADWPTDEPIAPSCDFLCQLAEAADTGEG